MEKTITKEELTRLYNTMTQAEICRHLDVSPMGLYQLLDSAKIPRKKKWTKRTKWELVD